MGEYLNFKNGGQIKLGTCESLYYIRYDELKKLNHPEGRDYLDTSQRWFYRFPFPDEDNVRDIKFAVGQRNHNAGIMFVLQGKEFNLHDLKHYIFQAEVKFKPLNCTPEKHNLSVQDATTNMPCIQSKEALQICNNYPLNSISGGETTYIQLVAHKYIDRLNAFVPLFRCPFCGVLFRMEGEDIENVQKHINQLIEEDENPEQDTRDFLAKVRDRLTLTKEEYIF